MLFNNHYKLDFCGTAGKTLR